MLLNWLADSLPDRYRALAARLCGLPDDLIDVIIDAAALVASADQRVTPEERVEAVRAARQIANLEGVGLRRAVSRFRQTRSRLAADGAACDALLAQIAAAGLSDREARLVLHAAGAVAAIDGDVSEAERRELLRLAHALGRDDEAGRLQA